MSYSFREKRVETEGKPWCEGEETQIKTSYFQAETVRSQPSRDGGPGGQFTAPYVSYTQDEFSSSVQRIFLLAALHTEDVDLAEVASRGDVLGVWGEGDRPRVDWRGEQTDRGTVD